MESPIKWGMSVATGDSAAGGPLKQLSRIVCLSLFMPLAAGAENEATAAIETALPDLEFLEFLGQFETDNGEWVDPGSLLTEDFADLLRVAEEITPTTDTDSVSNTDDAQDAQDANNAQKEP